MLDKPLGRPTLKNIEDVRVLYAERVGYLIKRVRTHDFGVGINPDRDPATDSIARCHRHFEDMPVSDRPARFPRQAGKRCDDPACVWSVGCHVLSRRR